MKKAHFQAYYKTLELSSYTFGNKKFIPVFASSNIKVYPYQIAAAGFAMRSPYLRGCILCDEGSLGKTYEAMLVAAQMWYENKNKILIIITNSLLNQWEETIEKYFSVPFFVIDNNNTFNKLLVDGNPFDQDGIILTTYRFMQEKGKYIKEINWDLTIFEEAHHLKNHLNENNKKIKSLVENSFKLLLTATPIQNSIMDLYGLISFIDERVLPDEKAFYQKYFRKPENYAELAMHVSKYCFRTTRKQAAKYISIPERVLITIDVNLNEKEKQIYDLLKGYINKDFKFAFPNMEKYDLSLMLCKAFSSSMAAFSKILLGIIEKLEKVSMKNLENKDQILDELYQLKKIYTLSKSNTYSSKSQKLLEVLNHGFSKLKDLGANKKVLIFTENKATQQYIFDFLSNHGYRNKILIFNGDNSRDYSIIQKFKDEAEILIATDVASEGLNLEFCSFVINYDLPYNVLTMEQRINRCHRQGQRFDVLVINFFDKNNFFDVRMFELINKRISQFSGIFEMTDSLLGNFDVSLEEAMNQARSREEIEKDFNQTLNNYEIENKMTIKNAENILFTSFSKDIANKFKISPEYIENSIKKLNDDLWFITKYFFGKNPSFYIDEKTRTISCAGSPPKVFTGSSLKRNEYSMSENYMPRSGRHTLTGSLAKRIIKQIISDGVYDKGKLILDGSFKPCEIGLYEIEVGAKNDFLNKNKFSSLVGKTTAGLVLNEDECKKIIEYPMIDCECYGTPFTQLDWWKSKGKAHENLDDLINKQKFLEKAAEENSSAENEEIDNLKRYTAHEKSKLSIEIAAMEHELKKFENSLHTATSMVEKLNLKKDISVLQKSI